MVGYSEVIVRPDIRRSGPPASRGAARRVLKGEDRRPTACGPTRGPSPRHRAEANAERTTLPEGSTGGKSIRQATEIRNQILWAFEQAEKESDEEKRQALLTFVLVGAGPTGVEMAGSVAGLAHKTLTAISFS